MCKFKIMIEEEEHLNEVLLELADKHDVKNFSTE